MKGDSYEKNTEKCYSKQQEMKVEQNLTYSYARQPSFVLNRLKFYLNFLLLFITIINDWQLPSIVLTCKVNGSKEVAMK